MLLDTIGRVKELATHPFTVVCNEAHRFIVAEQLREAGIQNHILLEPSAPTAQLSLWRLCTV